MLNPIQNQTLRNLMVSVITSSTVFAASSQTTATSAMPMVLSRAMRLRPATALSRTFSTKTLASSSSSFFSSSSPSLRLSCSPLFCRSLAAICLSAVQSKRQLIRCKVTRSGDSGYSPLSNNSNWSDRPPTEIGPLFPGCDYEHWLIVMDPLNEGKATKQEMIDHYIKTLAKVLGSEEAAKKSIYNVSCERYYGFGCQIDEETSTKLEGLPGVCFVLPDSYVDVENKDYGAELLVDGKIVERSPERQRRVTPQPMRNNSDRPRYNDRTRYVRRRENQSQGR